MNIRTLYACIVLIEIANTTPGVQSFSILYTTRRRITPTGWVETVGAGRWSIKTCVDNWRGPKADVLGSPINGEKHSMRLPYNTTVRILVYYGFMAPPSDAIGLPWGAMGLSATILPCMHVMAWEGHGYMGTSCDCHGAM